MTCVSIVLSTTGRNVCLFHFVTSIERGHCVQKLSFLVFGLALLAADVIVAISSIHNAVSVVGCELIGMWKEAIIQ